MTPKNAVNVIAKNGAMPFVGALDRKKMTKKERYAYEAFCSAKARSKKAGLPPPEMGAREFIGWWLKELKTFNGKRATCGRIDHSRGYFWDNIEMQDMADNSREMAARTGAAARQLAKGLRIEGIDDNGCVVVKFDSIRAAARELGMSQRNVQFLVRGKYKRSKKAGGLALRSAA